MARRDVFLVLIVWLAAAGGAHAQMAPPPLPDPSTYWSALQWNAFGKRPTTTDLHFNAFAAQPRYDQSFHGAIHAGLRDQAFLGPKIELDIDYLMLLIQGPSLPPLLTTSTDPTNPLAGALGEPGTFILDSGRQQYGPLAGGRVSLTWPIIDQFDVAGSFLFSEQGSNIFDRNSDATGNPLLSRPFFDVVTGQQARNPIADPNTTQGFTHRALTTRVIGAETVVRWHEAPRVDGPVWSLIGGFNFMRFDERLFISDFSRNLPPVVTDVSTAITDDFSTSNRLYAGQFGAQLDCCFPDGVISIFGKISLGAMEQNLTINGSTVDTDVGIVSVDTDQGLYAQPTNAGRYDEWRFGAMPEVGLNITYYVHPRIRISLGYTFMYLLNVIRPDDQINQSINLQQITQPPQPPFAPVIDGFNTTNIWIQHLNVGGGIVF